MSTLTFFFDRILAGLDYLLLQKMKQGVNGTQAAPDADAAVDAAHAHAHKGVVELKTTSLLGSRLKALVIEGVIPTTRQASLKPSARPFSCARTAYEFDVDILSEADLPTTITRSAKVLIVSQTLKAFIHMCIFRKWWMT